MLELNTGHLSDLLTLSASAHWNQTAQDWQLMLASGNGWGIVHQECVVASAIILPYPPDRSWISMVLVLPEFRRQGLASQLMQRAIGELDQRKLTAWLDATDAGRPVYQALGFSDCWRFTRWQRTGSTESSERESPTLHLRPVAQAHDLATISALDANAFGAPRASLLSHLLNRAPALAWIAQSDNKPQSAASGFVLGRDGARAWQIGPLAASDESLAIALLDRALAAVRTDVFVDLPDSHQLLATHLQSRGFTRQRSFTRMVRSRDERAPKGAPSSPAAGVTTFLVAGPELG